jgi:hypothetical protein
VIFSDGEDQGSVTLPADLVNVARRTTPTLGIVLASSHPRVGGSSPLQTTPEEAQKLYAQLVAETGGFLRTVAGGQSLASSSGRCWRTSAPAMCCISPPPAWPQASIALTCESSATPSRYALVEVTRVDVRR